MILRGKMHIILNRKSLLYLYKVNRREGISYEGKIIIQ